MGIIAANIIIGGDTVLAAPKPVERSGEGSFLALREKLYAEQMNEPPEKQENNVSTVPLRSKKVREADNKLIQYKESAFLSDMLSSSKD
jgi:hypothetical protein